MTQSEKSLFIFKVELKNDKSIWRRIAIRWDQTLAVLHRAIFIAFDREEEHLYTFYFTSKPTSTSPTRLREAVCYSSHHVEEDTPADTVTIEGLALKLKKKFEYLFDYGDEWWHLITLEAIQPLEDKARYPKVIESQGDSPPQYPEDDEF